ncbi:hypothetical protein, partial [Plasmodium yoelii yoelii]
MNMLHYFNRNNILHIVYSKVYYINKMIACLSIET